MNTADFQRGQDQKEGDNATKPFGTVSNAENFVPGHHHKKKQEGKVCTEW